MEKKFVANKGVLVNPQGQVLFVRDSGVGDHAESKGVWDLPGGRMEPNETPLEGLARELREEIGVEIIPQRARVFHVDLWGVDGNRVDAPIIGIFYLIPLTTNEIHLSEEHTESLWIDPRQTVTIPLKPIALNALEAYRRTEGIVTAADKAIQGREGFGLVQVLTGNGKGKTTAALGEVLRAHAIGKKTAFVYFDKGGTHYSERRLLEQLGIPFVATGRDRIDPQTNRFDFSIIEQDKEEAQRGLAEAKRFMTEGCDLLVLDEINSSVSLGMLEERDVLALMDEKPDRTELVLTGRNAPESLIQKAHLVTEMRLRKHYFYSGVLAREGLDY